MSDEHEDDIQALTPQYPAYERQKCFVGHSHSAPWCDDILDACRSVLPQFDLEPWYAEDHFDATLPLREKVVELIANARYGIYDLSCWRRSEKEEWTMPRNVLIELGIAIALNRPMLLLRHKGNRAAGLPLPACLEGISDHILEFSGSHTLESALKKGLEQWATASPEKDWWNLHCTFGDRRCDFRQAHPYKQRWPGIHLSCHISDGHDTDRDDFRASLEDVLGLYENLSFSYLDELPPAEGYDFLLCTQCQAVRSSPFSIYRISAHSPAETFIAIGMSLALEKQFSHKIPTILLTTDAQEIPSLLQGYEVVVARNDKERISKLRKHIPQVLDQVHKTTWKHRPLPFIEIQPRPTPKPAQEEPEQAPPDEAVEEMGTTKPEAGLVEIDGYRLLKVILEGHIATLYQARDTIDNRLCALKVLHPEHMYDNEIKQQFFDESRILASLDHNPHIVKAALAEELHSDRIGEKQEPPHIYMEYIDGPTLRDISKPIDPLTAIAYARQMAFGLLALYDLGVVHQNINSHSILIDNQNAVKITGFTYARFVDPQTHGLDKKDIHAGPTAYSAPEQISAPFPVDIRADLYSVAVLLFEMLTGQLPFRILGAHRRREVTDPIPTLSSIRPDFPPSLDSFMQRALAWAPNARFQTPQEFSEALDMVQHDLQAQRLRGQNAEKAAVLEERPDDLPSILEGRYRLVEPLSRSGFANVWKAYVPADNLFVTVNIIRDLPDNYSGRFPRVARLLVRLNHPNVIKTNDFGKENDILYTITEYIDSSTLTGTINQGPLSVQETLFFVLQAAEGLAYVHNHAIVHCNVKPGNMLLRYNGQLVLSNFEAARNLEEVEDATDDSLTGTPFYLSPEQVKGKRVDGRSDIYSLGITMFHCLTSRMPFVGSDVYSIVTQHLDTPLPIEPLTAAHVPAPVIQVIQKMTAKQPDERYPTMEAVIAALITAATEAGIPLPPAYQSTPPAPTSETASQASQETIHPIGAVFYIRRGPQAGKSFVYPPDEPITIGRTNGNRLVLPHRTVSRRHARIWWENGNWYLQDEKSSNGTFLNGIQLARQHVPLRDGDVIALGEVVLSFHIRDHEDDEGTPSLVPVRQ